jgi:hypothetical protein
MCPNEATTCPISFNDNQSDNNESNTLLMKKACCNQQIQTGQKLTCRNSWKAKSQDEFRKIKL